MYLSFDNPSYLAFLFLLPVVIFLHFFSLKNIRGKALKFANFESIARVKGIDLYSKNLSLLFFDLIFVLLLVLILAGTNFHMQVNASSFSYVIAIDSSQSMLAKDLVPDRITVAKETAIEFIDSSPFDSPMGIVSFAGNSYIEQELTNDKMMLKSAVKAIETNPVGGTDVYEAISTSAGILKDEESKAVILLSDGQINTGEMTELIDFAKEKNVLVHTIAIGTVEGGEVSYGISKLDEDSLKSISYYTGGKYFNIRSKKELSDAFSQIMDVTVKMGKIELGSYLLMICMLLFIIRQFLISMNKVLW